MRNLPGKSKKEVHVPHYECNLLDAYSPSSSYKGWDDGESTSVGRVLASYAWGLGFSLQADQLLDRN